MKYNDLPKEVISTFDQLNNQGENIEKLSQYGTAGYITFDLLVSQAIFMQVTRNLKVYKKIKKGVLNYEKSLLKEVVNKLYDNQTIWSESNYSIKDKIRVSYQILGYEYLYNGYDRLYNAFVDIFINQFQSFHFFDLDEFQIEPFEIEYDDFVGTNNELIQMSKQLNISYSLLYFSLHSRSQLGFHEWEKAEVPLPSFIKPEKISNQKRLMFNIGKTIVLLTSYEYYYNTGSLDSIDIIGLTPSKGDIERNFLYAQLHKLFRTEPLSKYLYNFIPKLDTVELSDNDKSQVFKNLIYFSFIIFLNFFAK